MKRFLNSRIVRPLERLDFDIHSGRQRQCRQRVNEFWCGRRNIHESPVHPHLELLACVFVDECRSVHRVASELGRERYWPAHLGTVPQCRLDNLSRRRINHLVIVRENFHAQPGFHLGLARRRFRTLLRHIAYWRIFVTTPAPTVLPPSRSAKRCFSSSATGATSFTFTVTVSPGITISVPSGNATSPVTSHVRM